MSPPSPVSLKKRMLITGGFLLLVTSMIALGMLSNRPAPPRSPDDPQPLLHIYRQGHPVALLDSLPLQIGDELRLSGEVPTDLKATFFLIGPSGQVQEFPAHFHQRVGITGLMTDHVAHPAQEAEHLAVDGPPGLWVCLLCAGRQEAPTKTQLLPLLTKEPWPPMPPFVMMRFTRTKIGPVCSRGARLPAPEELKAIDQRLTALAEKLKVKFDFFAGAAVVVK